MPIDASVDEAKRLLERVRRYNQLIMSDNFAPSTIEDMKSNAKDICEQAKNEITEIKNEVDQWG